MPNVTKIPLAGVPLLDARTGMISREWYRFLQVLFQVTGAGSDSGSLQDLAASPDGGVLASELAVAAARIGGLEQSPVPSTHPQALVKPPYGVFYNSNTQTAAVINTAYGVTFPATLYTSGVTIPAGTPSQIYVPQPGVYKVTAQLEVESNSAPVKFGRFWLRVNGADVAATGAETSVVTAATTTSIVLDYVVQIPTGAYIQLMWAVSDLNYRLLAKAAAGVVPVVPSSRVSISRIGDL